MNAPDQIRVTADQNPALIEALQNAAIGDKGVAELHFTLKARDGEGVDLIVEAVVPEGYEIAKEEKPGAMGGMMSPDAMMTPTAMQVRKMAKS
jgi:hypothetical protein